MGKDMSSVDAPFGVAPYGPILRAQMYAVNTAPTINIFTQEPVQHGGTMVATPIGYLPIIEDGAAPTSGTHLLGTVLACFDETLQPVKYIAAADAGNGTIAGYVLVADHPDQIFMAQEDGDTNAIDLAECGQNADLIWTVGGSTTTGLSGVEIDSTSAATTAALQIRLIRPHEDDTPADDTNCHARWLFTINEHFYNSTDSAGI